MTAIAAGEHDFLDVLVADAVLAPSSHNSQPWSFRIGDDAIEVRADRSRRLPVNDPDDRELAISCGAALFNLVVSAEHHGWTPAVALDESADRGAIGRVRLSRGHGIHADADDLWAAIDRRSTWRHMFTTERVDPRVAGALVTAAADEGAIALPLPDGARPEVSDLVAMGDEIQFGDPAWRHELASWMHPRRDGDGLTVPPVSGAVTRAVVSTIDLGSRTGASDARLTLDAPLVLVIASHGDEQQDWVRTGMALQHVLLAATGRGLRAGFLNQPCQVSRIRPLLADLVGLAHPQLIVRLGHAPAPTRRTPRRPVYDVLVG